MDEETVGIFCSCIPPLQAHQISFLAAGRAQGAGLQTLFRTTRAHIHSTHTHTQRMLVRFRSVLVSSSLFASMFPTLHGGARQPSPSPALSAAAAAAWCLVLGAACWGGMRRHPPWLLKLRRNGTLPPSRLPSLSRWILMTVEPATASLSSHRVDTRRSTTMGLPTMHVWALQLRALACRRFQQGKLNLI